MDMHFEKSAILFGFKTFCDILFLHMNIYINYFSKDYDKNRTCSNAHAFN